MSRNNTKKQKVSFYSMSLYNIHHKNKPFDLKKNIFLVKCHFDSILAHIFFVNCEFHAEFAVCLPCYAIEITFND